MIMRLSYHEHVVVSALCEAKPTEALCTKEADDKCNWDGTCKDDASKHT